MFFLWLATSIAVGASNSPAPPIRLLPLGDSITYGFDAAGGYRAPLCQLLTNAGDNIDFVGTQNGNGVAGLPDGDHEGHPGWRIDQIYSIIASVFDQTADTDNRTESRPESPHQA